MELLIILLVGVARQLTDPMGLLALAISGFIAFNARPWWQAIGGSLLVGVFVLVMVSDGRAKLGLGSPSIFKILFAYAVIGAIGFGIARLIQRARANA